MVKYGTIKTNHTYSAAANNMQRFALFNTSNAPPETILIPLPSIPTKVGVSDIGENGKLLPDNTIKAIFDELTAWESRTARFRGKTGTRYKKSGVTSYKKYSIIKEGNTLYAIYKGEKHHKLLGRGTSGRAKLAQNLTNV